jgi:flavin reductase (DIM6/NTAB) family NADH-FMN oxidoreductase RutF
VSAPAPPRRLIPADELVLPVFRVWSRDWFLLAAGDFAAGQYNCMTVGWGGLARLWDRPVALVAVKPSRHTSDFLRRFPGFTLNHFAPEFRKALLLLGTRSGRDGDKLASSGLTPMASTAVPAPCFAEADLVLECAQAYADDYRPELALLESMAGGERSGRPHRLFFGEVRAVLGDPRYARPPAAT